MPSRVKITPPPLSTPILGHVDLSWAGFFTAMYELLSRQIPNVSVDNGDASISLVKGSAPTQLFLSPLTAGRTVTLPTIDIFNGMYFRFVRASTSTGAFNLSIGGLKNLATGTWCDVEYTESGWRITAYGSL